MPPTENQNPAPAPVPAPVQPPAAPISPAPSTAPAGMPPTGGMPPKKKMGVGAKIALTLGVLFFLSLAGIVVFNVIGRLQNAKNSSTTSSTADNSTTTSNNTSAADLNCGVNISEYPSNPGKKYVKPENQPSGFNMHDTGDEDSIREYCQGAKLKVRAEEFIGALSSHEWAKAFGYLTKSESASTTLATRSNQWATEYGAYTFSPSNYPLESPTEKIEYGIEVCRKEYMPGWTKSIQNGFYSTPFLTLDNVKHITTQISVAMTLEDGIWKVAGDNNKIHNTDGIINGDAYSQAQNGRDWSNFYDCK